ncbi:MAG: GNAT family N-acetyltransferase [Candidatus Levybacteria bacterium]|nr:GNAT family N-acetyltransferase [Candidatus Levybacteria bacterium]
MEIKLVRVKPQEKDTLSILLKAYKVELNEMQHAGDKDQGEYKYLDSYWREKNRFPFFIFSDNILAGFVLINDYSYISKKAKTIAEFFVLKSYRKKGIGEEAARKIFDLFPGEWEIGELITNKSAQLFWRKVIGNYTNGNYMEVELYNERWHGPVQIFKNKNLGKL